MGVRRVLPGKLRQVFRSGRDVTRGRLGIRARLLSIVLITSVTLLLVGVGSAGYLAKSSLTATVWANLITSTTTPVMSMVQTFEEERRLSLLYLADAPVPDGALAAVRERSDTALAAVIDKGEQAQRLNPGGSAAELETFRPLYNQVPGVRAAIDSRAVPREEAFEFFNTVIGTIFQASLVAARVAPDAGLGIALGYGVEPLRAAESLSRADALGAVALAEDSLTPGRLLEFSRYTGEFRAQVAYSAAVLKDDRLAQLQAITDSSDWQQVTAMQDALVLRGPVPTGAVADDPETTPLPMTVPQWLESSGRITDSLLKLWEDQSRDAHAIARAEGTDTASKSLIGGIVVLIATVVAFVTALVIANRFIGRMRRLRDETLDLADDRLPDLVRRLDSGAEIDTAAEVARLDFGTDELGEVADAFNRAQVAAVSAAVAESRTRAGFRTVFLNIAHRNQLAVHRQLALLDRAERREENPDQLELLFELDHLATRARRHAENLIVLGGENPGRRWRKPVPLWDLIRGAAAETLDYTRVHTGTVPDTRVTGLAAADLIHLLAELMDNAAAFSPPASRVEVSAAEVGRGMAIEVSDQGLGMPGDEITTRNHLLSAPPDFGVATLTDDTRLGLFVVATLAARHGVSVRLSESLYGGVKAVVLIPTALIESEPAEPTSGRSPVTVSGGAGAQQSTATGPASALAPTGTAAPSPNSAAAAPTNPEPGAMRDHTDTHLDRSTLPQPAASATARNGENVAPGATGDKIPHAAGSARTQSGTGAPVHTGPESGDSTPAQPRDHAPARTDSDAPAHPGGNTPTRPGDSPPAEPGDSTPIGDGAQTRPGAGTSAQPGHGRTSQPVRATGGPRPADDTTQPPDTTSADGRPALPRRRRKQAEPESAEPATTEVPPTRTPEQARTLMSAIEGGTRSGRRENPDSTATAPTRQEGDDDQSRTH